MVAKCIVAFILLFSFDSQNFILNIFNCIRLDFLLNFSRYDPLLHILSQRTASYSNCIESATSIISSATNLESQSLVVAFGGPDIFFTRMAPSKGFDSLPENFNRPLLLLVVIGLLMVLNVTIHRSKKKIVTMGWA